MEIDERVLNEFFVYLCCYNPDILRETVLIFSKCSFCGFVMWERRKSKDENIDVVWINVRKKKRVDEE